MKSPLRPIRRVVTGHEGKTAVVALDGVPPEAIDNLGQPGLVFTEIWRTTDSPARVDNSADPTPGPLQLHPGPRGSVMRVIDVPPETGADAVPTAEMAKKIFEAIGSSSARTAKEGSPHPMMHRTETIDYAIVMEGELWMILDDSEVKLQAGDIVIQRGTNHAWSNRSGKYARIAFILLNGKFVPELQ